LKKHTDSKTTCVFASISAWSLHPKPPLSLVAHVRETRNVGDRWVYLKWQLMDSGIPLWLPAPGSCIKGGCYENFTIKKQMLTCPLL
jgi:hypothetical protein